MHLHKEGRGIIFNSFVIFTLIAVVVLYFTGFNTAGFITLAACLSAFLFVCCFFRVPARTPRIEDGAVIAPADGTIVIVKEVYEGEYLKTNCMQVSIFMSVFNVHVNWFPISGVIEYYKYHPGKYLVAMHPKSSEKNERTSIVVNNGEHKVLFRQIAGLIARRIVCYAKEGEQASQCSQVGFIKFGSRIDLFLPLDSRIQVTRGQKVTGTDTIIAKLPA